MFLLQNSTFAWVKGSNFTPQTAFPCFKEHPFEFSCMPFPLNENKKLSVQGIAETWLTGKLNKTKEYIVF